MLLVGLQIVFLAISLFVINTVIQKNIIASNQLFYTISVLTLLCLALLTELHKPKVYQKKLKYIFAPHIKCICLFFSFSAIQNILFNFDTNETIRQLYFLSITVTIFLISNLLLVAVLLNKKYNTELPNEINMYTQENLPEDANLKLGKIDQEKIATLKKIPIEVVLEITNDLDNTQISNFEVINEKQSKSHYDGLKDVIILDVQLNYIQNINKGLSTIYSLLKNGGILILSYEELNDYEERYFAKSNNILRTIRLIKYYLFERALPKIPLVGFRLHNIFYKYNVLSKGEVFGRLVFNGFDIIKNYDYSDKKTVVVKKIFTQSKNPNPSYYPLITLNRVSLFGKIIKIHKLRSMYPYSEFIQKKVFEEGDLSNIGKFKNDFRITKHGMFFRKYWLDELPQIYDWIRGEVKLVGIRAMSQHFFSLYPQDYKELYLKVKPGIISPIFDEKTTGFDEIVKIEKEYLVAYLKNPFKTDVKYFFKTISQMIKGVRSK